MAAKEVSVSNEAAQVLEANWDSWNGCSCRVTPENPCSGVTGLVIMADVLEAKASLSCMFL